MGGKLLLGILMMVTVCTIRGALFTPKGYTLMGVEAVNGSYEDANCPEGCVMESTCICRFGGITGTLIDGVVPTIDTTQRDASNNLMWASQLYTARRTSGENVTVNFKFPNHYTLRGVELYMFNCPLWGIGAQSIHVTAGLSFPTVGRDDAIGSTTLTGDMQSCSSLTRVSIPIQNPINEQNYSIDFTTTYEWVHIGEVRFSDQLITTTAAPTTAAPTTMVTTTVPETMETPTIADSTTMPEATKLTIPTAIIFQTVTTSASTVPQPDTELSTSQPPPITTAPTISASNTQPILLPSVIIAVLLLVIVGGIGFLVVMVWIMKAKTRNIDVPHDNPVEMKTNEAYGPVGGGVRNMEEESQYEVIA